MTTILFLFAVGCTPQIQPSFENSNQRNDIVENIVIDDRKELEDKIMENNIEILFGSSYEKKIAQNKNIPLIRFSYPVVDEISLSNIPLAGFRGVPTIIERIINEITKA